jgi:hypothetical protein
MIDDLGSAAFMVDLASMERETQYTRTRDRLTPTGQARGIGMRKYSKILGAFSMSLASLLGFVAIDILLEPDATMVQHARADNARLLNAYPDGFALDATHHPHITMLQQFVRTADLARSTPQPTGFWPTRK